LGIYAGWVSAQFGGPQGKSVKARAGDVIIVPAGVSHKNLDQSSDFRAVGAYPRGRMWDMNTGKPAERPRADEHIKNVPLPEAGPVFGKSGPLIRLWKRRPTLFHRFGLFSRQLMCYRSIMSAAA
jgi:uncharacterized protein YjlB